MQCARAAYCAKKLMKELCEVQKCPHEINFDGDKEPFYENEKKLGPMQEHGLEFVSTFSHIYDGGTENFTTAVLKNGVLVFDYKK